MAYDLRVLEAARAVADEITTLLRKRGREGLIHRSQLSKSAQSVSANIREALGRDTGPDRNQFYRYARGSAEETDEHIRANHAGARIPTPVYWRLHNRLMVIIKMLNSLMSPE
jgi:four helix bundle protein